MTTWLELPKPWLFLAPMAGVADWAFREVCYRMGAEIAVSFPMPVSSMRFKPRRLLAGIDARHGSQPFIVQLIGHIPEDFETAARAVTENLPVVGIDINMGCPAAPVVRAGSGAALLRDPDLAAEIVAATCRGTHLPVSVKIRSGWNNVIAPELAPRLEAAGAKALTVHGRTREQLYRGESNLDVIAAVKRAVSIPVVGNGDVTSVAAARRMLEVTGVDGIMVGRGVLGNPWLFADLKGELKGANEQERWPDSFGGVIREHARLSFMCHGAKRASGSIRRHLAAYSHGKVGHVELRERLQTLRTLDDVESWIDLFETSTG